MADKIVTFKGKKLIRREKVSPRQNNLFPSSRLMRIEVLWQAEDADRDFGYWYPTRREAFEKSNATDKVCR